MCIAGGAKAKGVTDSSTKRVSWAPLPMVQSEGTPATEAAKVRLHVSVSSCGSSSCQVARTDRQFSIAAS